VRYYQKAHRAAKKLLQSSGTLRFRIERALSACQSQYASPLWAELLDCDYAGEMRRYRKWWSKEVRANFPGTDVEVLFIALQDLPVGFTLRGSTEWSRDPNDWAWWYHDNYRGPGFESSIMSIEMAFARAEIHDQRSVQCDIPDKAKNSWEVLEQYFSLVLYGSLTLELIRTCPRQWFMGQRRIRWFVIGHPDALYGIILGKLTPSRWFAYHG
jgi:hypothetical protein